AAQALSLVAGPEHFAGFGNPLDDDFGRTLEHDATPVFIAEKSSRTPPVSLCKVAEISLAKQFRVE
ncbi:MAG: hypothetical protein ACO3F9_08830, partial [Burkholderiales bacterium]